MNRYCTMCGSKMDEGYIIEDEYYCSDECLEKKYSNLEIKELHLGDENSENYWTEWEEDEEEIHYCNNCNEEVEEENSFCSKACYKEYAKENWRD